MNMVIDRPAWLAERRKGIGGSDVAAILGLSQWRTPFEVWQDKRGVLVETPENAAMRWGNLLEPVVRQEYSDTTGRDVLLAEGMLTHSAHPFMLANLDGFTPDGRIYEGKTARTAQGWGEPGTDEVPQAYLFQVQHYMAITGYPVADIAVLIGGSDFRIYTVEADLDLHEMLIAAEAEFWRRVVENDPPETVTMADAVARWGRESHERSIIADADLEHAVGQLRLANVMKADAENMIEEHKATIMRALGDADTLVDVTGKPLVTWKASKPRETFDAKALKAANPEIHAQFVKVGNPSRTFLIK